MVQALLMGLLALLNGIQGPYHWYFFREPVMAGFWVGLIYGDPVPGNDHRCNNQRFIHGLDFSRRGKCL